MAEILIAGLSAAGHITPLLAVAGGLAHRGDRVTVLTSPRHAAKVSACGARLHPLPPEADLADGQVDDIPERAELTGLKRLNFDITELFIGPMPRQAAILTELFAENRFDAVIVDSAFFGILPFLLGSRAVRAAGADVHPDAVDDRQPRHRPRGAGPAARVGTAGPAAQSDADRAVAQRAARPVRTARPTAVWMR